MRTVIRLLLVLLSSAAGAVLALNQATFLPLNHFQIAILIVGIAVIAVASPALETYFSWRANTTTTQELTYDKQLSDALRACIVLATRPERHLDILQVSGTVYRVQPGHRRVVARAPDRMNRVMYEHFSSATPPQPANWASNKGVIGRVWQTSAPQTADFTQIEQQWNTLSKSQRMNLTRQELDSVDPKDGVIAVPLLRNGTVCGAVSLSTPSTSYVALTHPEVWLILGMTRDSIQDLAAPGIG